MLNCICPRCCYFVNINGIQNLRYPRRLENNQWRFGKRQDLLSQPRIFLWKPALKPGQMYPNAKTPVLPLNYNRYGLPPAMAPIHQSYMFAIPTKINYTPYQPVKEIDESRKPGNLHHITIINAIIPKPYMPTAPTYTHPTTTFRNYRSNNKLLYHQYFNNNYGRQNMENLNKLNSQQIQLHKQKQQQQPVVYKNLQNSIPAATLALMVNKPTLEYMNLFNYSTTSNYRENKINNTTTTSSMPQCGRKTKDDSSNSANNILYYYCNNRILNYKNPVEYYKESPLSITTTTPKTMTTTTTKSLRSDYYTTEKSIFLPTPNTPPESSSFSAIPTTIRSPYEYNFVPARSTYNTKYVDVKLQQQLTSPQYEDTKQQATTKYDDFKRKQQRYTTTVYDDMKLHSFFTIEDAVTSAPQMQVFNDPYQAYRHARKHHNHHQRQTTTTKKPIVITTTKNSILKSFFDDLDDEDYVTSDAQQYDYTFLGQPQKSAYRKPEMKNDLKFPKRNKISDHTYKTDIEDSLYVESHQGKPKIKEHHFGIFEAITPISYIAPAITTYKPYENFKDNSVTTQKSFHSSYKPKTLTYATTTEMRIRNEESETTTPDVQSDLRLSTTLATSTTTEKKPKKIYMKTPLNLRSTSTYKYPKQRGLYKPFKNLTSSTSSTARTPLKKTVKYQRQYKSKRLKQFKHLFTTSTTTTSTTTTVPTTEEYDTKKVPLRTFATTSTTEATTTRKIVPRTSPTTEAPNTRKKSTRFSSTTEVSNAKTLLPRSSLTTETNTTNKLSTRRGFKRANNNKPKEKEDSPVSTSKRTQNKGRRRHQIISTTAKTPLTSTHSYSTYSSILPTSSRTFSTTTTMKSIMRISSSKSRPKAQNDIKPYSKNSNEVYDDISYTDDKASLKSITSTMTKDVGVPPLPIEIYFKKSHNAKIYNANK